MAERGFLTDTKVLFLGDYDLTSLAILPLAKNCEIWVLDVDKEVLEVIEKESHGAVAVVEHNLLNPLPKRLVEGFDVVFTDPPYTPQGVTLFLSRALEALSKKGAGKILLSYGSLDPVRILTVQGEILEHRLLIEELASKFNEYLDAKTVGNVSDLYTLCITEKTKPLVKEAYSGTIYTHQ